MFSSLWSTVAPVDPTAQNFFSATTDVAESDLFGPLQPKDTEWLCAGGFVLETQTFYTISDEGIFVMCQVIHSSTGLWYPTVQATFKYHNPKTGQTIWKSINITNFIAGPPKHDKRSCKADQLSLTYKSRENNPDFPEVYTLTANLAPDLQVSFDFERYANVPGWKLGKGPKAGYSDFGVDREKPDGYVIHRFWPRLKATGHVISAGQAEAISGHGIFSHAIQGMRPDQVASGWNFQLFLSNELGGVSGLQMEFTTCDTHGKKGNGTGRVAVNVGSIVVGNKLVAVTAETRWPGDDQPKGAVVSRTTYPATDFDAETGYQAPTRQVLEWKGPSILADAPGTVEGKVDLDLGTVAEYKGLIDKIDFLAEIPYVIKVAVNYVAGTKPYLYQWMNPTKLHLSGPDAIAPGLSGGVEVEGMIYTESTFIS